MFDLSKKTGVKIDKKWYRKNMPKLYYKVKKIRILRFIGNIRLPLFLDFVKWCIIDIIRGKWKNRKKTGIYQFVALPGEGKTLSMVEHIIRDKEKYPNTRVYTNFNFKGQNGAISHWIDMIKYAKCCVKDDVPCILAMDEIHITFDSSNWRDFPPEMLALISFNRKYGVQLLCSSQIYERIPKKIRDISNYTVLCKNVFKMDRLFVNYYYDTNDYEMSFEDGKKSKASFVRFYIADDNLYSKYNTLEQVDRLVCDVKTEKNKREEAIEVLFGAEE